MGGQHRSAAPQRHALGECADVSNWQHLPAYVARARARPRGRPSSPSMASAHATGEAVSDASFYAEEDSLFSSRLSAAVDMRSSRKEHGTNLDKRQHRLHAAREAVMSSTLFSDAEGSSGV